MFGLGVTLICGISTMWTSAAFVIAESSKVDAETGIAIGLPVFLSAIGVSILVTWKVSKLVQTYQFEVKELRKQLEEIKCRHNDGEQ